MDMTGAGVLSLAAAAGASRICPRVVLARGGAAGILRNRATNRPVIAPKLHHTMFTTKRLDEMVAWYELAVG